MFRIRKDQIEALDRAAYEDYQDRAIGYLREAEPEAAEGMADEELRQVVTTAADRAEARGFVSEPAAMLYARLQLLLGDGFEADPDLADIVAVLDENDPDKYEDDAEQVQAAVDMLQSRPTRPGGPR
jgi:hypothetical protein